MPTCPSQQRNAPPIHLLFRHKDAGITSAQLLLHQLSNVELLLTGGGGRQTPPPAAAAHRPPPGVLQGGRAAPPGSGHLRAPPPRHATGSAVTHVPPRPLQHRLTPLRADRGGGELRHRGREAARGAGAAGGEGGGGEGGARMYLHFRQALTGGGSLPPLLVLLRRRAAVP